MPRERKTPSKLLAEWFWTDRWMGSSAFLLPMEARGLYREMLTQSWRRGGRLPNDFLLIQRAIGATKKEWARAWPLVSRFWHEDGEFLVNDTQLEIYAKALAAKQHASLAGTEGNKKRWNSASSDKRAMHRATNERCGERPLSESPPSPDLATQDHTRAYTRADSGNGNGHEPGHRDTPDAAATAAFLASLRNHRAVENS